MPLRCPAGATRAAPLLAYTSSLSSRRIPLRICSSCRARLSFRGVSTLSNRRRPTSLRYQLLADNLLSQAHKYGIRYPAKSVAYYATDARSASLPSKGNESLTPKLVILGTPTQRPSVAPLEFDPINKDQLDGLALALQTFEFKVAETEVPNEILLFKPESLRVSRSRFEQLVKDLDTAFLGPQVKDYLQTTNVDIAGGVSKLRKKQALNLVMREVWKVQIDEEIAAEMDVVKEKELGFERMHLFFMMMEGGDMLQKLASRNRTRIILNTKSNTVVLKGTKASIEHVEHQLRDLPARITSAEVDISSLLRVGNITETYIPSISRLTSVFLEIKDNKLTLYGLIPYGRRDILDAKRLMFNSSDLHLRQMYSLLGETRFIAPLTGALYPVMEDQTLPWLYRGREWCRWRSIRTPKARLNEPVDESDLSLSVSSPLLNPALGDKVGYNDIRVLLDSFSTSSSKPPTNTNGNASQNDDNVENVQTTNALENLEESTESATAVANPKIPPGAEIQTTYRAVIGQILHASPTLPQIREPKSLSDLFASNPSHVLCNSVPKVLDFLSTLNPVTYQYDFKILLKFSPSPWHHPKNFEHLPPVEMELQIKPDTNELQALKVGAVESHSIVDVLMPRNTCDLRFVKRTLARVEGKTQRIKEYIKKAKLDVLGEDRLEAGEELTFTIPRWMVRDAERIAPLRGGANGKNVENGLEGENNIDSGVADNIFLESDDLLSPVPITYFFTGLETRSSTTFDFDGSPLVYTKVEAGASGGSYDEIVLECQEKEIEYLTPLEQASLGREDEIAEEKRKEEERKKWEEMEAKEMERVERERLAREQYLYNDVRDPVYATGDPKEVAEEKKKAELERIALRRAERLALQKSKGSGTVAVEKHSRDSDVTEENTELPEPQVIAGSVEPSQIEGTEDKKVLDSKWEDPESEAEGLKSGEETQEQPQANTQPTGLEFLFGEEEPESAVKASQPEDQYVVEDFSETATEEPKIGDEESGIISDVVFQSFVHTARKLVEALENTEPDHERVKPKRL